MKCRMIKTSVVALLGLIGSLAVIPQAAHGQVIGVAAGVWGWRNLAAPQVGGPWIAPEYRFRPFANIRAEARYDNLPTSDSSAQVIVTVPDVNAQVWIEGTLLSTTGQQRVFVSPPLERGFSYTYEIRARWVNDKETVEQTRVVPVRGGERVVVDFSRSASK